MPFDVTLRVCVCEIALLVPELSAFDAGGGSVNVTWFWRTTQTPKHNTSHLLIAVCHRRHGTTALLFAALSSALFTIL